MKRLLRFQNSHLGKASRVDRVVVKTFSGSGFLWFLSTREPGMERSVIVLPLIVKTCRDHQHMLKAQMIEKAESQGSVVSWGGVLERVNFASARKGWLCSVSPGPPASHIGAPLPVESKARVLSLSVSSNT